MLSLVTGYFTEVTTCTLELSSKELSGDSGVLAKYESRAQIILRHNNPPDEKVQLEQVLHCC